MSFPFLNLINFLASVTSWGKEFHSSITCCDLLNLAMYESKYGQEAELGLEEI